MATILLIDDNKFYRLLLHDLLRMNNHEVLTADDVAGIQLAKIAQPDIILCDIDMPNLDHPLILESLQRIIVIDEIPFVLLANQYGQTSCCHAIQPGSSHYISKLTDSDSLLALISRLVPQRNRHPAA